MTRDENVDNVLNLAYGLGLEPERVVISEDQNACIYFFNGDRMCEIECNNSGEIIGLLQDRQSGSIETWEIDSDQPEMLMSLEKIKKYLDNANYGKNKKV